MIAKPLPPDESDADSDLNEGDTQATSVVRQAVVPPALGGKRLDQAAAELFDGFSRSRLTEWIKAGSLTLDGAQARPRDPVTAGQLIDLETLLQAQLDAAPEDIALDLLYEDEHLLVVNKPPGLVVHPGAGNPGGTLLNALLHHDPRLKELPRAGLVHRLDKDTSGALVVARTLQAHAGLVAQLAARDIHRRYEAVVQGAMVAGGTVDAAIDRHPRDRLKMAVREDGRPSVTHYRLRERFRAHTLLQVTLETGRTHQIRVLMAHIRHPIVGDALYGSGLKLPRGAGSGLTEALRGFRRQALHAERLEFEHPARSVTVAVDAPRPADLDALVRALLKDRQTA